MTRRLRMVLVLLCLALGRARAQGLRLDDVPATGMDPGAPKALPLDATQRAAIEAAIKSRNYSGAEQLLVAEIERNPQSDSLLTFLGRVFFLDGKYLNAAVAFKKAEALTPLDNSSRFTLSLAYVTLNHRDWARPELEKLARLDPRNALYPYWLGRLDYDAMQFRAAVAHLSQALELDPKFVKGYDNLGLCYDALGQFDEAIRAYRQAIELNHQQPLPSPWPPLNLGTLLVKLGRLEEAEAYLRESLRYDSRLPRSHYELGVLLEKKNRNDDALRELTAAVENDPSYPEPHYTLGKLYRKLGNKTKADQEWDAFQRLKKESSKERPH